ncbi:MAG: hypothetical protein CMN85_16430 [Spongiibacteraceae bacterium]|nr:hypothetical protein [Spongiibacteraceae bacterium]|tara:strand:- start:762 stop:944 length:183 start_codon:yes stop_codon:yes gene_type:complete
MKNISWPIGTFINMAAVAAGSLIGLGLEQLFSEGMKTMRYSSFIKELSLAIKYSKHRLSV